MNAVVPIWFDALEVGQIEVATDGSLSLRYADRWLQTGGAFPLSVTMPLRPARLPDPKSMPIKPKDSRYERGTTGGQVKSQTRFPWTRGGSVL